MTRLSFLAATVLLLAGCSHTVQTTSGADYLSKHPSVISKSTRAVSSTYTGVGSASNDTITTASEVELIRQAASVEPLLTFPARFGLARIEGGDLTTIPADEAALWEEMARRFKGFGSVTPVDPIIVEYTNNSLPPATRQVNDYGDRVVLARDLPTKIRYGAARQHLDAVLIYEVGMAEKRGSSPLKSIRLSVLGRAQLSDHSYEAAGAAKAILLDVRNAYPYGTAQIETELSSYSSSWHSTSVQNERREKARKGITTALVSDVEDMLRSLISELQAKQLQASGT